VKLPEWSKRSGAALGGTANLLALTIVAWASFLTWDKWLALIGGGLEFIFLSWAAWSKTYRKRLESKHLKPRPKPIDLWLLIVTVSGFVVILFFGFGKLLLTPRWLHLSHAQGWEAGAIGWTALFLIYYLFKFKKTKNPELYHVVFISITIVSFILLFLLWYTMDIPVWHVTLVLALGWCFFGIDLFLVFALVDDDKDNEKGRSLASLVGADIPMVVTLSLLLLYLGIYSDADNRDVFVSGVVACQLLFSNAVFVLTEFAWLQIPSFGEASSAGQIQQNNREPAVVTPATSKELSPNPAE
jgi:hypothetical protein